MKIYVDELPRAPEFDCPFFNHLKTKKDYNICVMPNCFCGDSCPLTLLVDPEAKSNDG